jgi:hypothetical protein
MRAVEPSEILLKTEKITLVIETIGDGKIRCSAGAWEDCNDGQVLEVRTRQAAMVFSQTA